MPNLQRAFCVACFWVALLGTVFPAAAELRYAAELLPPEIGTPAGMNDHGVVVGSVEPAGGGAYQGVKWDPATGLFTYSGIPAGMEKFFAKDINNAGEVCGTARNGLSEFRAVYWETGRLVMLPQGGDYNFSEGNAINEFGYIGGEGTSAVEGFEHRFGVIWDGRWESVDRTLPSSKTPPTWHEFYDINDSGEVVGGAPPTDDFYSRAVRYDPASNQLINLGKLDGTERSKALAVNESHVVVGYCQLASGNADARAVYWDAVNVLHDLTPVLPPWPGAYPVRPYRGAWARDINDNGVILIEGQAGEHRNIFLYNPATDTEAVNVEDLLTGPSAGLDMIYPVCINNPGQILCYGDNWAPMVLHPYEVEANQVAGGTDVVADLMGGAGGPDPGGCDALFDTVTQEGTFTGHYDTDGLDHFAMMFLQDDAAKDDLAILLPGDPFQYWVLDFEGGDFGEAAVTLHYDDTLVGDETALQVAHFTGGAWEYLVPTALDPVGNTLTVDLTSFSPLVLVMPEPATLGLLALGGLGVLLRRRKT